ncbi:hypothetical protein TYRP_010410 [Tyrophagus putrescentiae]|nr:hypothetical protein TYRP_010410 [Tyrophagus putrescentiae]
MVIALLLMVTGGVSSTSTTDYTAPSNRAKFDRCANFTHACLHEWSTCESQLKCHGKKEHMRGSQESCDYINSLALKMNRRTACPGGNFSVCLVSGAPPPPVTMSGTMMQLTFSFRANELLFPSSPANYHKKRLASLLLALINLGLHIVYGSLAEIISEDYERPVLFPALLTASLLYILFQAIGLAALFLEHHLWLKVYAKLCLLTGTSAIILSLELSIGSLYWFVPALAYITAIMVLAFAFEVDAVRRTALEDAETAARTVHQGQQQKTSTSEEVNNTGQQSVSLKMQKQKTYGTDTKTATKKKKADNPRIEEGKEVRADDDDGYVDPSPRSLNSLFCCC